MMHGAAIGPMLRRLRTSRAETLRSAARELQVDPAYLSRVERGSQAPSDVLTQRAAIHYETDVAQLALAAGDLPGDIVEIVVSHPELIDELRRRFGPLTR